MAILEVKNIKKSFGKTEVLKDISFSLNKGEVLTIIGSSGSGKTTLLRCLNFLEFAESGTISVRDKLVYSGENHKKLKDAELRENRLHFGLVFQQLTQTLCLAAVGSHERQGHQMTHLVTEGHGHRDLTGLSFIHLSADKALAT